MVFGTLRPEADSAPGRAIPKGARASIRSRSRLPTFRKFLYTRSGERGYASGPEPLGTPALRFADRLFGLVALFLRPVELVLDVVLNPPEAGRLASLGVASLCCSLSRPPRPAASFISSPTLSLTPPWAISRTRLSSLGGSTATKNRPVFFRAALPSKQNPTFWLLLKCTMARAGASQGPVPIGVRGCRNVGPRCPARVSGSLPCRILRSWGYGVAGGPGSDLVAPPLPL
jgi:hypothetical protein